MGHLSCTAQHSLATWPECSLEPSSLSGCTLFLRCSTTLIQRNSWKVALLTQSWVNNRLIWIPQAYILCVKYQHSFSIHFAKSTFCGWNITSLSSHSAPALAFQLARCLLRLLWAENTFHVTVHLCDQKLNMYNSPTHLCSYKTL